MLIVRQKPRHIGRMPVPQRCRLPRKTTNMKIILASSSPRRAEILRDAGIAFEIRATQIDETAASRRVRASNGCAAGGSKSARGCGANGRRRARVHCHGRGHDRRAGRRNSRQAARRRARARNARRAQRAHSPRPYRNFSAAIAGRRHARGGGKHSRDICSARAKKKSTPTSRPASRWTKPGHTRSKDSPDDTFPESRAVISMSWDCRWRDFMRCCANWAGKTIA